MAAVATLLAVLSGGCRAARQQDVNVMEGLVYIRQLPKAYHVASIEDDAAAVRVINALHFDPYFHPDDIAVTVSKGGRFAGRKRRDG